MASTRSSTEPRNGTPAFALSIDATAELVGSSLRAGLSVDEARNRLERNGPNQLDALAPIPAWRRFAKQFREAVVLLLLVAGVISLALGEFLDAAAILAIVMLNGVLGFFQEERAAKAIHALREMSLPKTRVLRGGVLFVVPTSEVTVGDRVELEAGDQVPADVRLIESVALRAQEAALTGESVPVDKDANVVLAATVALAERRNSMFAGTIVSAGRASGLVVATGMATELGRIAALLESTEIKPTPLQVRLAAMGRTLALVCVGVVIVVGALYKAGGAPIGEVFVLSIGLAVAAVPEGLPAVVTIALALGMRRLVERNALVRTLPSVETLGSVTVICTDKTGTLTRNEMSVREIATTSGVFRFVHGARGAVDRDGTAVDAREHFELARALEVGVRCNNARWSGVSAANGEREVLGDPTETALLVAAANAGVEDTLSAHERVSFELPFDSERKRMSVATLRDGVARLYVKGAAELVLARCTRLLRGERVDVLDDAERQRLSSNAAHMAERALRVLAVAYRDGTFDVDDAERELTFVGLIGLQDPPREEVTEAIRTCQRAGIRPVMITGDHPQTALAVAREIGLASATDRVVRGEDIERWSDDELRDVLPGIAVFARTSAEHKLRIVRAWQKRGEVVAMTGDGVNDAPALQEADIGIAMGSSGTDVSRQAADVVLVDDNFASIVAAVREGRGIYDNIGKFVHFLLTTNISEILTIAIAVAVGAPAPLTAIQLLWINLVTDGLPALALGVEPTEVDVMERHPRPRTESIVPRAAILRIVVRGVLLASAVLAAFAIELNSTGGTRERAMTLAFAVLVFGQLACAFGFRSRTATMPALGWRSNPALIWAVLAAAILQLIVMMTPPLRELFELEPLRAADLGRIAVWSLAPATVIELEKLARARRRRSSAACQSA